MKAQIEPTSANGGSSSSTRKVAGGAIRKVNKVRSNSKAGSRQQMAPEPEENPDVKAYLDKLQEMVPFMPKNKRLSKLEVITHAIDYIRDLRDTLGLPQCDNESTDDSEEDEFFLDSFTAIADTFAVAQDNTNFSTPATLSPHSDSISTKLSVSVSTTSPAPSSPNENFMDEVAHHQPSLNNSGSGRQPFCAIANLHSGLSESAEESLKLKQISCRL